MNDDFKAKLSAAVILINFWNKSADNVAWIAINGFGGDFTRNN